MLLIGCAVFVGLLYVVFGQITVRRLRKNAAIKDRLGIQLASGWDIINITEALSLPKLVTDKFRKVRCRFFLLMLTY